MKFIKQYWHPEDIGIKTRSRRCKDREYGGWGFKHTVKFPLIGYSGELHNGILDDARVYLVYHNGYTELLQKIFNFKGVQI